MSNCLYSVLFSLYDDYHIPIFDKQTKCYHHYEYYYEVLVFETPLHVFCVNNWSPVGLVSYQISDSQHPCILARLLPYDLSLAHMKSVFLSGFFWYGGILINYYYIMCDLFQWLQIDPVFLCVNLIYLIVVKVHVHWKLENRMVG